MLSFRGVVVAMLFFATPLAPAAGQSPPALNNASVLHLTDTADRNVPRDRLRAELAAESADPDAAKVQAEINRRMSAALARIKSVPDIAVEMNGYSVYQERVDKGPMRWRGSQSMTLTAKDFASLLALIGVLQQDGLVAKGLAPLLSREARQAVEDELTEAALARLQKRAERIATQLGSKIDIYRDIRVGNVNRPVPVMRAMSLAQGPLPAPPPVAEPGEALVSVTVEADVVLAR